MSFLLPAVFFVTTVVTVFLFDWWPWLLFPDMIAVITSMVLSGTVLRGHRIDMGKKGLEYVKGWSRGSVDYSNLIVIYRIFADDRDTVLIVFKEKDSFMRTKKCLSVDQLFSSRDRDGIFQQFRKVKPGYGFKLLDRSSLEKVKEDKRKIKWVPV